MVWTSRTKHVPTSTRARILKRDNHTCIQCGANNNLEIDHINNTRGPNYNKDNNLQTLCRDCHKTKTQQEAQKARRQRHNRAKYPTEPHPGLKPRKPQGETPSHWQ
ncbi:HNH endonuclease [Corynebacterium sp. ZY180755]